MTTAEHMPKGKHIPNILSVSRIFLSLSLFFVTKSPVWFIVIYALSGLTDFLDGYIARRFHLQTDLGAKLDTIGDTTLIIVIASSILAIPWIVPSYMPWVKEGIIENLARILVLVAVIIFVKLVNLILIRIKFGEFNSVHTIFNKCIGLPIFLAVPICVALQRIPDFLIEIVCIVMILAFLEETLIAIRMREFEVNTKSFFTIKNPINEQCPPQQPDMVTYSRKFKQNVFKLDIASFVYPILAKKDFNDVYRMGFTLRSAIDPDKLQAAAKDVAPRFPSYYVQLKKGMFWYFFRPATDHNIVAKDDGVACRPFELFNNEKPLFRVLYDDENNIFVEFFHCVTDGLSAMNYLKTLTARYLELCGKTVEKSFGVLDITQAPDVHEFEDSYRMNLTKDKVAKRKEPNAYQYKTGFTYRDYATISGVCSIDELKAIARRYNCTITEFILSLCGFLLLEYKRAAYKAGKNEKHPVILNSAVDLRPTFNSKTLHNFVMLANLNTELDGASPQSVGEVASVLKPQFQSEWGREKLQALINVNVKTALSFIAKLAPLVIKKPITKIGAVLFGERKHTANITNLGLLKLPKGLAEEVVDATVMIGPTVTNGLNAIAIGHNNRLRVTFSCAPGAADVPFAYFKKLEEFSIETEVQVRENKAG